MLNGKIEFYGEYLSLLAISKKIGISRDTLNKHYEQTGDIYEAIRKYDESKIEYNGEKMTLDAIAKKQKF